MGFSVSGAAAVIFATMFVTFGMWYTASANSFDRVSEAESAQSDTVLETRNTEIGNVNVTYNNTTDVLTVRVDNIGASQLTVAETDLLVDGQYRTGWADAATVAGTDTRLWLAGETLTMTVSAPSEPARVKIATANGVSTTTTEVTLT
jgi:flagellar protein FlaF